MEEISMVYGDWFDHAIWFDGICLRFFCCCCCWMVCMLTSLFYLYFYQSFCSFYQLCWFIGSEFYVHYMIGPSSSSSTPHYQNCDVVDLYRVNTTAKKVQFNETNMATKLNILCPYFILLLKRLTCIDYLSARVVVVVVVVCKCGVVSFY